MKKQFTPVVSILAGAVLAASSLPNAVAAGASGSDFAFNEMVMEMAGRDSGSLLFDYYVEGLNQQIAAKEGTEPYGAAGPSGPLTGFDGYLATFAASDTGSIWFDTYVDTVHRVMRAKGYRDSE